MFPNCIDIFGRQKTTTTTTTKQIKEDQEKNKWG